MTIKNGYNRILAQMVEVYFYDIRYDFRAKIRCLLPYGLSGIHVCIFYAYWFPRRYSYQIMFMSFKSNTTGITSEAGIVNPYGAHEFIPGN